MVVLCVTMEEVRKLFYGSDLNAELMFSSYHSLNRAQPSSEPSLFYLAAYFYFYNYTDSLSPATFPHTRDADVSWSGLLFTSMAFLACQASSGPIDPYLSPITRLSHFYELS